MALINDPRMYSTGAVTLDSSPSVSLYAQLMAKRQAKDEAIDEYYKKLPHTLNGAGMRDQDRAGFDQALAKTQQYWMQNKDKIRKGNSQEAFNYEQMFRELGTGVERSKSAGKTDLELGKMRFNKENGYIFKSPKFIESQHAHALPIYDPNHKEMDLGTVAIPPKPFETEDQDKLWASATKGVAPGKNYDYSKQYTNPNTGQVIVPFAKKFSDDQIKQIKDKVHDLVKNDESALAYYQGILDQPESAAWQELNKAYSKYHKDDIVDTPEKAAAAEAIIRASVPQEVGEEQESNYQQKKQDTINKIYIQDGLIRSRQSSKDAANDLLDYDVLGTYKDKVVTIEATKNGVKETFKGVVIKDVDQKDQELIGAKPYKENGLTYYKVRPDGDWEGKDGQVISWAKVAQANLDKTSANEAKRGRTTLTADKTKTTTTPKNDPAKTGGKVTVILKDGRKGEIPANQVDKFLKDNPGSKRQ